MVTSGGTAVVVGVDGSPSALQAVAAAAQAARLYARPLRIVHAFIWPLMHVPMEPVPGGPAEGGLRNDADRLLAEAEEAARKAAPDIAVECALVDGAAAPVLIAESRRACLLVLGDRGLGGFTGLLVGSVAVQLAAHAACPVLVVRGDEHPTGPVVVGVDGSATGTRAVDFAMREAHLRGVPLVAVHAWTHPVAAGPGEMLPMVYDAEVIGEEEDRVLAEALAGRAERYPDLRVVRRVVRQRPAQALVDAGADAQLLVVGTRGRGGFRGLLLGSTSQTTLHHAPCAVALVRPDMTTD
ncbi:MAG TPA: universal stress protein [Pilimelia sp.]|nr:universal stress protein [Pilimelia sp.]